MRRINHANGYTYPGQQIKVPEDLAYADLLDFSPFPLYIEPFGEKAVIFDPAKLAWAAYDADGQLLRWGPATGGGNWCKDIQKSCRTREGEYRIYSLGSSTCASRKYPKPDGGAPMPYCMFFNGGEAFHGSPKGVRMANVSHGCVRLFLQDAEWLRYDFVEKPNPSNDYKGTKVIVLPYEVAEKNSEEASLS